MSLFKFILFFLITLIVMLTSWSVGNMLGNVITGTAPPMVSDPALAGLVFIGVCALDSLLICALIALTDPFTGRRLALILFVFTVQTFLPQMETFFFGSEMGISVPQTIAIVIAGAVMSATTVLIALLLDKKLSSNKPEGSIAVFYWKSGIVRLSVLIVLIYPLVYLTFGYYVAWQNENLRLYYTSSTAMNTYGEALMDALGNGIYIFQILRASIWIFVTIPVIAMLNGRSAVQLILVGLLTSLLPASLLLIPNPYMPQDVAMTHFIETATSNLLWGMVMVLVLRKSFA